MMTNLGQNTADLEEILAIINELPEQNNESIKTCSIQLNPLGDAWVESVAYMTVNTNKEIEYKIIEHESSEILTLTDCICNSIVSIKYNYGITTSSIILNGYEELQFGVRPSTGAFSFLVVGLTVEANDLATIEKALQS